MTETQIQRLVRNYNWQQALIGFCTACGAIVLWLASFWIWRFFTLVWLRIFGVDNVGSWSFEIAIVLTALLAIEGVRYKKRLFDLIDYHESIYYQSGLRDTDTGAALSTYYGNPMGMAYLVSQALFSAPRTTVFAIKCFRSIMRVPVDSIADAARIYDDLESRRAWVPADEFPNCGKALCILDKLKLIWTQVDAGEFQIRIPPLASRSRTNERGRESNR